MTSAASDPIAIALRVATAIEAAQGSYFVGGSVASSLQGDPRSTNDIDIVISLPLGQIVLWCRQGGGVSDKQWRDIVSILRVSRDQIDTAYLLHWAARLRSEDLLARAQADAGT